MEIGAHVPAEDPLAAATERGADCVQLFLSNPQGWKKPAPREDASALRASPIAIYVHAPYLVNVASVNNRVRIPSRKILQQTCDAAQEIAAAGVIVHGGHVGEGAEVEQGIDNWRKAFERLETDVPVLIENTAGGESALARRFDVLGRLWEAIGDYDVGFCFDTCHAHAAGEPLEGAVQRVRELTGRIDLVHANDSKDAAGSGRDRHENLGLGQIPAEALVDIVRAAGAPVIVETPGGAHEHARDLAWLRERVL